jgi:hypothetical protein
MDFGQLILRLTQRSPLAAHLFVPVIRLKDRLQTQEMHRELDDCLEKFFPDVKQTVPALEKCLRRDAWYSFLRYHCPIDEYFIYRFYRLSPAGRREFVSEYEKDALCEAMSSVAVRDVLADKGKAYRQFAPFYGRDVLVMDGSAVFDDFVRFVTAHPRYIVKPCRESCGRGVRIVEDTAPTQVQFEEYQQEYVVLEELIVQDEALAKFHPQSVNTIRCATMLKDGVPHILFTFIRLGRGKSIVDNGGAGGLIASIDTETGIITTPGMTETGYSALCHPDTGMQILGAAIPRWEEMKKLAASLALTYPQHPYISWDLALTGHGWVMVEGNSAGQFVGPQLTTQQGMRAHLSPYFDL